MAVGSTGAIGTPLRRKEDPRFITGTGTYLDDVQLADLAHAAILRSPYAHARIRSIDTAAAAAMPGVLAVYTGQDLKDLPALPCAWPAGGASGGGGLYTNNLNTPRLLALDDVKWAGEGVAMVVAESPEQAQDALEVIDVDYEPLRGRGRRRAGHPARCAAAPRERPQQRRLRVVGRGQGRHRGGHRRPPRSSSASGSSTSGSSPTRWRSAAPSAATSRARTSTPSG